MLDLGKCTNFGNCEIADKKQIVKLRYTDGVNCPTCGRPLTLVGRSEKQPLVPRRTILLGGGALVALAGVGFCSVHSPHGKAAGLLGLGGDQPLLTLSGSGTIGAALGPALAKAFLESNGYSDVTIAAAQDNESDVTGLKGGKVVRIHFVDRGSDDAFKDLGKGAADIAMASRQIRPDEAQALAPLGQMTATASEHVIGLDAVSVIVNSANPVSQLSVEQLADIFAGRVTNWTQVGGQDGQIHIFAPKQPSDTLDFFKDTVLKSGDVASGATSVEGSAELSGAVAADPQAIGFVEMAYVLDNRAVAVSAAAREGARYAVANALTVKSEIYPITRRLYLYTAAHPGNPVVSDFLRFATGSDGQAVVAANHFVRYDVEKPVGATAATAAPSNTPTEYQDMTRNADLLQIVYFNTGSRAPQPLATAILDSLPNKLGELGIKPGQIMLFGFTDNVGSPDFNLNLSRDRVGSVAHALDIRGIKVGTVEGFGGTNFLRSNRTEADRQYNRRIEIWARKAG